MSADGDIVRTRPLYRETEIGGVGQPPEQVWCVSDSALARLEAAEKERDELRQEVAALNSPSDLSSSMFYKAQRDALAEALRQTQAKQPETLEKLRTRGVVFDKAPMPDPDDPKQWQLVAFWIYNELCEVESIARAALAEARLS